MSKRKHRNKEYRKILADIAEQTGGFLVNAEGGQGENKDLRRLVKDGVLVRVRKRKLFSPFGPHIKQTMYIPKRLIK